MNVYVDADACPVVSIVEQVAKQYNIPVTLLCDTNHVISSDYSEVKVIGAGADAVDFALIGMLKKDVKKAEEANGLSIKTESTNRLVYENVSIAGRKGGMIIYDFDNDGKLIGIDYSFRQTASNREESLQLLKKKDSVYSEMKDTFDTFNRVLADKYNLIGTQKSKRKIEYVDFWGLGNEYYPFTRSTFTGEFFYIDRDDGLFKRDTDVYGFNQYLAADGENYVEIVVVCCLFEEKSSIVHYTTMLRIWTEVHYRPVTKEKMEEVLKEAESNRNDL